MSWEYLVDVYKPVRHGDFNDWLNARGQDDWELVKYDIDKHNQYIKATFKRKK